MASFNVACATPVGATQDAEFSMSTEALSNNGRLGDADPVELATPDVTGETILRDLGLVCPIGTPSERLFDVRNANVGGGSACSSIAPLGHFASPRTEVAQVGGVLDRDFTGQARSSFASVDDMPYNRGVNDIGRPLIVDMPASTSVSDGQVSNRDLVMGSQLGLLQSQFVNTSPAPFGSGTVVDGMASASSNSMFGRDVVHGNRKLLGNLFDDFVTIPRSEYDEMRLCKVKAEELLSVVFANGTSYKN
jgi:hypothetical protein